MRSSRSRTTKAPGRCASTRTGSSLRSAPTRTRAWRPCARSSTTPRKFDLKCVGAFPAGPEPAGRGGRQEVVPDLHEVRRARHRVRVDHGRARTAHPVLAAGRRPSRRGLLVLPRAEVRHPTRLRAVDRPRGEAHAEVAEPLLLDHRVRAQALPQGHHRIREHPRRRQDHLERLLPCRAQLRPDLRRAARTSPFRDHVWPKFLHENAARVFKLDS